MSLECVLFQFSLVLCVVNKYRGLVLIFFFNSSSLCAELIYILCDVKMIAAPGILRCTDESSEQVVLTLFFDNLLQCLPPVNFKVTVLQHSEGLSRCVSPGLFLSFNQLAPVRFIGLSSSSFSPLSHPFSQPAHACHINQLLSDCLTVLVRDAFFSYHLVCCFCWLH